MSDSTYVVLTLPTAFAAGWSDKQRMLHLNAKEAVVEQVDNHGPED